MEGRLVVGFVVMENGNIKGLRIENGLGLEMNNLALTAFHTLKGEWQPARLNGENVRYYQLFPINFIYRDFDFDYLEMRGSMLYWEIN
jgi:periplasmic protein TonB